MKKNLMPFNVAKAMHNKTILKDKLIKLLPLNNTILLVGRPGDGKISLLQEIGLRNIFTATPFFKRNTEAIMMLLDKGEKVVIEEINRLPLSEVKGLVELFYSYKGRLILTTNDSSMDNLPSAVINRCIILKTGE